MRINALLLSLRWWLIGATAWTMAGETSEPSGGPEIVSTEKTLAAQAEEAVCAIRELAPVNLTVNFTGKGKILVKEAPHSRKAGREKLQAVEFKGSFTADRGRQAIHLDGKSALDPNQKEFMRLADSINIPLLGFRAIFPLDREVMLGMAWQKSVADNAIVLSGTRDLRNIGIDDTDSVELHTVRGELVRIKAISQRGKSPCVISECIISIPPGWNGKNRKLPVPWVKITANKKICEAEKPPLEFTDNIEIRQARSEAGYLVVQQFSVTRTNPATKGPSAMIDFKFSDHVIGSLDNGT